MVQCKICRRKYYSDCSSQGHVGREKLHGTVCLFMADSLHWLSPPTWIHSSSGISFTRAVETVGISYTSIIRIKPSLLWVLKWKTPSLLNPVYDAC